MILIFIILALDRSSMQSFICMQISFYHIEKALAIFGTTSDIYLLYYPLSLNSLNVYKSQILSKFSS